MMTALQICEVSPRDGLQNEKTLLTTGEKIELVTRSIEAGIRRIEVTSFVHPLKVPQMADAEAVMAGVPRVPGVKYAGLVMNARGLDRALAAGVDEVDIVVVATDTFAQKNQGVTSSESIRVATELVAAARAANVASTITVGAAFGCPFEGEVSIERLTQIISEVVAAGPDEISLADTIGVAVPADVTERVAVLSRLAPASTPLRLHLHDTRHTGVANAVAAVAAGITVLDSSIGGAGGCPFAPQATGNVATEDLIYLFNRMRISTGVDLDLIIQAAIWLEERLGKRLPGALARAGDFPGDLVGATA
jgi:hydroxymethylglutaryl-CoA lyase